MNFVSNLQTWVPLVLGILSILGIIIGFIAQLNRKFEKFVKSEVEEVVKELRPNGGSSMRDQVNRLETSHKNLEESHKNLDSKVDTIIEFLINRK